MTAKKISIPLLFGLIAALCSILFVGGAWLAGPAAFIGSGVWLSRCIVLLLAAVAAAVEKRAEKKKKENRYSIKRKKERIKKLKKNRVIWVVEKKDGIS